MYKNSKTGKVENIAAADLSEGLWRRVALGYGIKLVTRAGQVYKYDGFREAVSAGVTHPAVVRSTQLPG